MSEPQLTRVVRGHIVVPSADVPVEAAEVVVRVEDVSRADAPSVVIAEHRQRGVPLRRGAVLPFALEVPADRVDARSLYSVHAHVDASGSGTVEPGDLISTRSYPVLTRGYGHEAEVEVQRV
jgi:putative lipoprotein